MFSVVYNDNFCSNVYLKQCFVAIPFVHAGAAPDVYVYAFAQTKIDVAHGIEV